MTLLQTITDNLGDLLGTSKLAQLNKSVFRPITGVSITREEYNMCDGQTLFQEPNKNEISRIKGLKGDPYARKREANEILEMMIDNGTVFSDHRIIKMNAAMQTQLGENALSYQAREQLSKSGKNYLEDVLHMQVYPADRLRLLK